ncbi:ABC transporter ATP-binding protein [Zavarzinia aquatilis]|uniref:ABC transporter ATP-binding protein n=2 Tax=Zavarzinia aquatilis TaxID=2211142 RepID=A0A317EGX4_9PROT|nr:ABC transporter substrate-binding protein [Zavarzinia aquatilis]PWR26021.1 ABC transporter ATP-binding protein [Zavarzinia aquatilis]
MKRLAPLLALCLLSLPAAAADRLTVLLDWAVNPDHAALFAAQSQGYFAAQGLEVELIAPSDPNDPPKLVAAGKADLAVTYQPQLVLLVEEGLPLRRVATLVDTPLNSLAVLADGPVKTIADLKGRKIGYSVAGFEDALLQAMLKSAGLAPSDVTLINVNFALATALASGQVDGVIGAFRNFEIPEMRLLGKPARIFAVEDHGVPAYDELVVVAAADKAGDPRIARFNAALEAGVSYTLNHPDAAWAAFVKDHPELNDDLNREAWGLTLPRLAASPAALDPGRFARIAAFLKEAGLIARAGDAGDYAAPPR